MQRWILPSLIVCILMGVLSVGLYWMYRQNKPDSQWVPLPLRAEISSSEMADAQKDIDRTLRQPAVLSSVVQDLSLQQELGVLSEAEAVQALSAMMFVREGEFQDPMTMVTYKSMNIGCDGKRKQRVLLGKIAVRLGTEVRKSLGIVDQK